MSKRVLVTTPGKGASIWEAFASELLRPNGYLKSNQHVAIEMSAAYTKELSDNLSNAGMVYYRCKRTPFTMVLYEG